jgi:nucleotide-binding universal stress UspA family protein
MKKPRIAVTTDLSDSSRAAFPAAAAAARAFGAEIHLVHLARLPAVLISPWPEVGPYVMPDDYYARAEERLGRLAREEAAFQGLDPKPRLIRGETAEALKVFVEEEGITLLVMAPHGLSGFKRFLLGSFTEQALQVIPCPVLVVHGEHSQFQPRRILVAHDFAPFSRPALAVARGWAEAFRARARLLFVADGQASLYDYAAHMEGSFKEYLEKVRAEALARFQRIIAEGWRGPDVEVEAGAAVGDPVEEILREAGAFAAELLVIGTHSRSGIERLLGSVTTKVVRKATCPVLVVRAAR